MEQSKNWHKCEGYLTIPQSLYASWEMAVHVDQIEFCYRRFEKHNGHTCFECYTKWKENKRSFQHPWGFAPLNNTIYQKHLNQFSKEESIKATFSGMKNEMELMIIYKKYLTTEEKEKKSS